MESNYKTHEILVRGQKYGVTVVTGKLNYINVTKLSNNPYRGAGKDFKNFDEAVKYYKSPDMKLEIIKIEHGLKGIRKKNNQKKTSLKPKKMATTKYDYKKIIQGNYGHGWEDISEYEATSTGSMKKEERDLLKADLKEYKASNQGTYKVIFRKTLKSKGMKAPAKKKTQAKKAVKKKTPAAKKKSPTIKKVCSRVISREGITREGKLKPGYRWRKGGGSAIKVKPKAAKKKAPAKKKTTSRRK